MGADPTDAVLVRRYYESGNADGSAVLVNTASITGIQQVQAIVGLAGGGFVVLYSDPADSLRLQVFSATSAPVGLDSLVANPVAGVTVQLPTLTALPDGRFVVGWSELTGSGPSTDANVYGRLYSAGGIAGSTRFVVGDDDAFEIYAAVAALDDGDLVFAYSAVADLSGNPATTSYLLSQRRIGLYEENDGGAGPDTILGLSIRDRVLALAGADTVFGAGAGDFIDGGEGDDFLSGDDADDRLFGGPGADVLLGGEGDDELDASGNTFGAINDAADALVGGDGTDAASYARAVAGVFADLSGMIVNTGEATGDTFAGVENLTGTAFTDALSGDAGANVLIGGASADFLAGRGGADVLRGGDGGDTASYADFGAALLVDMQNPMLSTGDAAGDVFDSVEKIVGTSFDDTIRGADGAQTLYGEVGDDVLEGRGGADVLDGGAGNDAAYYFFAKAGVVADLGDALQNTGDAAGDSYLDIEGLYGTPFADTLRGDALANTLLGRAGADILQGRTGDDKLSGEAGADLIFGEENNDQLDGGDGGDTLLGGDGTDTLNGRAGADVLDGGAGVDIADYREKTLAVSVTLNGASMVTVRVGGVAEDTVRNVERIYGGAAGDQLTGDGFANLLSGYAGGDTLRGGVGADQLTGGTEGDVFVYGALADSTVAVAGRDTITDFVSGVDDINLAAIDANNAVGGDQAFVLGALAAGQAGRLAVTASGGGWLMQGDVTGDGVADFAIQVNGSQPVAGDFIL